MEVIRGTVWWKGAKNTKFSKILEENPSSYLSIFWASAGSLKTKTFDHINNSRTEKRDQLLTNTSTNPFICRMQKVLLQKRKR